MDYSQIQTKIKNCRDILVGVIPSPEAQVQHITVTLIYKFMNDMDKEAQDKFHAPPLFFTGEFIAYSWDNLLSSKLENHEQLALYKEALARIPDNPSIPPLFHDIFKGAYLHHNNPSVLNLFLKEINEFVYDSSETLGDAFEHLLSVMSSQGDAGQFRTPRHIIDFIVKIMNPQKDETILDPACGTAGFLIYAYIHILKENMFKKQGDLLTVNEKKALSHQLTGYDISHDMVRLSKVNLFLHGFKEPKIFEYDTLSRQDRWHDNFDIILANPPFMTPKGGIEPHSGFSIAANRAEVLFVDYIAEHLTPKGRAAIIVPEGIIFQSAKAYKALRKLLVDEGYLWAVISLPAGIFQPYSGVKTSILLLNKPLAKVNKSIAFIKINHDGFDLGAQRRESAKNDLPQALNLLERFAMGEVIDDPLWQLVPKAKIAESGDYNLTGERYREVKARDNGVYPLVKLGDYIETITPPVKIKKENFKNIGKYPVIDQSQEFISAKTDDENALIFSDKPIVIFGDHTCAIKYIDEPFAQGADGIKILKTNNALLPRYLYYLLITNPIESDGYKRHFSKLKELEIPLPPLEIQNAMVAEIEQWQKVIDGAKQVVANYRPVIDIKPDWEMVKLGDVCDIKTGKINANQADENGIYPFFTCSKDVFRINTFAFDCEAILLSGNNASGNYDVKYYNGKFNAYQRTYIITVKNELKENLSYLLLRLVIENNLLSLKNQSVGGLTKYLTLGVVENIKIPRLPLEIQNAIVEQIEKERASVESCKTLIGLFEDKIKAKIAQVWGE